MWCDSNDMKYHKHTANRVKIIIQVEVYVKMNDGIDRYVRGIYWGQLFFMWKKCDFIVLIFVWLPSVCIYLILSIRQV